MRKLSIPVVFLAVVATVGCSFQVGSGRNPNAPGAQPAPATAPTPTPGATPAPGTEPRPKVMARVKVPQGGAAPAPGPAPTTPPAPGTPPPAGIPVLTGTSLFGTGTPDPTGWKGSFFSLPAGTTKLPALATMTSTGALFAKELNVAAKPMTGGFPGIDAARNENFGIRWEAPLIVETEADYTFRVVSDDGAILSIDSTVIIDNDGVKTGPVEKAGPVHLVKGAHIVNVDYFQATGPVALQLFCKKAGGTETVCPTRLQ